MRDLLAMCSIQRITNLRRIFQRFFEWQRTFKRFTFDVFEDEIIRTDVVQRADARVV
jgi:hypothetical protein